MSLDRGRMRAHHKFGLSAVASLLFAMSLAISDDQAGNSVRDAGAVFVHRPPLN